MNILVLCEGRNPSTLKNPVVVKLCEIENGEKKYCIHDRVRFRHKSEDGAINVLKGTISGYTLEPKTKYVIPYRDDVLVISQEDILGKIS